MCGILRIRMPSFICVVIGRSWLLAALFLTTKNALWAATCVILLYFRVQNSGYPLQGTVFVGAAAVDVELAVLFEVLFCVAPTNCVKDTDLLETVTCEFEEADDVVVSVVSEPLIDVVSVKVCTVLCPVGER